jgi:hypothetical protein
MEAHYGVIKFNMRIILGVLLSAGFFGIVITMLFRPVPMTNSDIIKVIVGFIGGAFVTMISFYFSDSDRK